MIWPNLIPISSDRLVRINAGHLSDLRRAAVEIERRTGCMTWIDSHRGDVCFGHVAHDRDGKPDQRVVFSTPVFKDGYGAVPNRLNTSTGGISVDDIVLAIQIARVGESRKARWRNSRSMAEAHDTAEDKGRFLEEQTGTIEGAMRHSKQSREMGKHYRPSAVVAGLKGT